MAFRQIKNPNRFHRKLGHKIAAAVAAGKPAVSVMRSEGYGGSYAINRASFYLKQDFVKERIEQLKERYAADIYDASVKAGLKALEIAEPRDLPKLIEALGKITPLMIEPDRKETRSTTTNIPLFPADLVIEEPPQLTEGECVGCPTINDQSVNVPTEAKEEDRQT